MSKLNSAKALAVTKRLFITSVFVFTASSAFGIEISEEMLNQYVEQEVAKKANGDIQILDPKVSLQDGYATICAKVHTKVLPKNVEFCADMTPKWRQETGALLATKMVLISLNAPGVRSQDIELVKAIVNQGILPGLDGIEIYRTDNFIGKQISGLKIMPGKLDLSL